MTTLLLILTFCTAFVVSTTTEEPTELRNALYTFDPVTEETFRCFRWTYHKFIARVYSSEGAVDEIGIKSIKNAAAANRKATLLSTNQTEREKAPGIDNQVLHLGMNADGSFIPCANEGCDEADFQYAQVFTALKAAGAHIETLWIYVEKTAFNWRTDVQANRDFIARLVETAEIDGQRVGIASTRSEYEIIFGDAFTNFSSIPMWWTYEDQNPDFSGYDIWTDFGGWDQPEVHTYTQTPTCPCGVANCSDNAMLIKLLKYNPSVEPTEEEPSTTVCSGGLKLAYSTTAGLRSSQVDCLKRKADRAIFRVSMIDGNPDHDGIRNVLLARAAGFELVDGTLTLCTINDKCSEAVHQLDTLVKELVKAGASIDTLWIRADDPWEWQQSVIINKMTLHDIAFRFDTLTNLSLPIPIRKLGIASYNTSYDTIFNSYFHDFAQLPLWWAWPSGIAGVDSFTSFGGWDRPEMHVYFSGIHCECDNVCREKAPLVVNCYGFAEGDSTTTVLPTTTPLPSTPSTRATTLHTHHPTTTTLFHTANTKTTTTTAGETTTTGQGIISSPTRQPSGDVTSATHASNAGSDQWKSSLAWIGGGAAILLIIAVIIVVCLCLRRKREQEFRKQLQQIKESHSRDGSVYDKVQNFPIEQDPWEISRQQIVINYDDKLGNGSFGYVYSGQLIFEGSSLNRVPSSIKEARLARNALKKVAVKTLPDYADTMDRKDFHIEIGTMKELLFHERVVNLVACVTASSPTLLIMEYCPNGDLRNFLLNKKKYLDEQVRSGQEPSAANELISLKDQLMFAVQIAAGLEYLTQRGYVHRDIAARNILLDENNACKIGDFGLCRRVEQAHDNYTSRGGRLPIKWMSPEAIVQFLFSTKSDVWSYGVVLFEIMTLASPPYPSWSVAEVSKLSSATFPDKKVLERLNKNERMNKPAACPDEVFEIMMRCWRHDPVDRPDFTRIREEMSRMLAKASDDNYYLQLVNGENYYALHRRKPRSRNGSEQLESE